MTRILVSLILVSTLWLSCASFIEENEAVQLKKFEKGSYILRENISAGSHKLKKGQHIRIFIISGDEFVKVYGYPAEVDFLKSDRVLILYVFEDDFKNSRYSETTFMKKLYHIIAPKK